MIRRKIVKSANISWISYQFSIFVKNNFTIAIWRNIFDIAIIRRRKLMTSSTWTSIF